MNCWKSTTIKAAAMNLIETEENYLFNAKMLLTVLLKEHFKKRKNQITPFEQIKLTKLIDRMIEGEIDYLHDDPDCYFELYNQDHLNN